MTVRLSHPIAVALVMVCASYVTPAALGGGGSPKQHEKTSSCVSAVCVYHEQNPTAGGQVPAGQAPTGKPAQLSTRAGRAIHTHAGKDAEQLDQLVTNPALGYTRMPLVSSSDTRTPPSALGAAFDIGPGPIALLLAMVVAVLLAAGGMVMRRR